MYSFDAEKISVSQEGLEENEFPSLLYVKNVTAKVSKVSKRAKYDRVVLTIYPERVQQAREEKARQKAEAKKNSKKGKKEGGEIEEGSEYVKKSETGEENAPETTPAQITGAEDPESLKQKKKPQKKVKALKPYQKLVYYDYPFKVEGCINTIVSSTKSKSVGNIDSKYVNQIIRDSRASNSGAIYYTI